MLLRFVRILLPLLCVSVVACDPSDDDDDDGARGDLDALAIVGVYDEGGNQQHEISEQLWTITGANWSSEFHIESFSNAQRYVVARNDDGNPYFAGAFSRFDWVENETGLWYCSTVYSAASPSEALSTERADDSEPSNGGCSDFPWSLLEPLP